MVNFCLQLRFIRHEWDAFFFDVRASLKNCSHRLQRIKPCGSFDPKADKLLVSLDSFLPHKKTPLEGSAHPRVLFALGLKNPHSFVTRGKGTPPHVLMAWAAIFESCSIQWYTFTFKAWVRRIFLWCGSKSKKLLKTAHVACKEQNCAGPSA